MHAFVENPWFRDLPPEVATAMLRAARPHKLGRGETLFRQGEELGTGRWGFFGITRGQVKFSSLCPDGTEIIFTVFEPGNWIGEVALLDQCPRANTATALGNVELVVVGADDFAVLMRHAGFAQAIARLVAVRLRLAMEVMADSAMHSTRERVLRRLAMLAHGDSTRAKEARRIITTSQDTLAMMLGLSRPTLNKELQALEREGIVALHYGRIEITGQGLLGAPY
jgi:CRP/FNR family cyclic AMP-dependent transcriptional regulator